MPRVIEIDGESHTIKEWADIVGLTPACITHRLAIGWSERDAVMRRPARRRGE